MVGRVQKRRKGPSGSVAPVGFAVPKYTRERWQGRARGRATRLAGESWLKPQLTLQSRQSTTYTEMPDSDKSFPQASDYTARQSTRT